MEKCVYMCIALCCNILCKFYCINKRDGNINKVYFALYMSARCFQYTTSAFLWREAHQSSLDWLLQMDQMIQSALDFPSLKIYMTGTSTQTLDRFLNFLSHHIMTIAYFNLYQKQDLCTLISLTQALQVTVHERKHSELWFSKQCAKYPLAIGGRLTLCSMLKAYTDSISNMQDFMDASQGYTC